MQLYRYPQTDLNQQNLDWMVNTIKELQERIANGSSGIAVITSSADMTDVNMIYIYRGSEAGYNYDHWYYWDSGITSWVDGGAWGMDMSLLPLSIANGGTGSATAADARTALGITPANIGAVATTDLPLAINKGGTGKTTAAAARTALGITPANIGAVATTDLPLSVSNGGTGSASKAAAAGNLSVAAMGEAPFAVGNGDVIDSIVTPGVYSVAANVVASLTNYPSSSAGVLKVINVTGDAKVPGDSYYNVLQIVDDVDGRRWHRTGTSGSGSTVVFGAWQKEYAVYGNNSKGKYLITADDVIYQWGTYTVNQSGSMQQIESSGIYSTPVMTVDFPIPFTSGTDVIVTASSRYGTGYVLPAGAVAANVNSMILEAFDFYARLMNLNNLNIYWTAIGR